MRNRSCFWVAGLLTYLFATSGEAAIEVGPWTFADDAFADEATRLDTGQMVSVDERLLEDGELDAVLTGYSPTQGLSNIGSTGFANHFQLNFRDFLPRNDAGPDLVFFDARFSADAYEFAVRSRSGGWSPFFPFSATEFLDTGEPGPIHPPGDQPFRHSILFGAPIELSNYGVAAMELVDAIQFRSLPGVGGTPQGDPVMAAALNGVAVPEPASRLTWLLLALGVLGGSISRSCRYYGLVDHS